MSWPTLLLLALVMWLDGGLRKVPAQSIVMRRSFLGAWRFVEIVRSEGWRAIGRWPSIVLTLVSTEPSRALLSAKQIEERLRRVRAHVFVLRIIGIATGLLLVVGAPVAVSRYGREGLYYCAAALLVLGLISATVSALASRRLDARGWIPIRFGAAYVWPFAGPYAAERVLSFAVAGGSPIEVLRALAGDESFARWARPHAFDALALRDGRELHLLEGFAHHFRRDKVEELMTVLPLGVSAGSRYCPRCGAAYQDDVPSCADCAGVALITGGIGVATDTKPTASRAGMPSRGSTIRRRRRRKR